MAAPPDWDPHLFYHTFWIKIGKKLFYLFTSLEIMDRYSAAGLRFHTILAGFNAPLEFLTGFTAEV